MEKSKIGSIFLVSVLALAGIGISYAGLTDTLNIYGTVSTGTVDLKVDSYSGTWVWKVYDAPNEVVRTNDPTYSVPQADGFLVSYAKGRDVTPSDPTNPNNNNAPYDAVIEFSNLFPCIDFTADIVFHYVGSIPAKVTNLDYKWVGQQVTLPDGTVIPDFIAWLMANGHMTGGFYRCDEKGVLLEPKEEVTVGYQLHYCNYFKLEVTIHLPQENWLQGLSGNGYVNIGVVQWDDQICNPTPEKGSIEVIKQTNPADPSGVNEFGFTVAGPGTNEVFTLKDGGSKTLDNLDLGTYTVTENSIPSSWGLDDIILAGAYSNEVKKLAENKDTFDLSEGLATVTFKDKAKPFDIEITKVASTLTPSYNVPFTYKITAHNLGPGDATAVLVNDLLPVGVDYISDDSGGKYNHVTGDWNIGNLAAGNTATLNITVEIPSIQQTENTQLCLLLDGSGSISSASWSTMLNGIASAINNSYVPHNEHVELTVIQFGGSASPTGLTWAQVELTGPVVLNNTNYHTIASNITGIKQLGGGTAMSCAFHLAADVMSGDTKNKLPGTLFAGMASTHSDWPRQVVNLVTDGQPNVIYNDSFGYKGRYNGTWAGLINGSAYEFVYGKNDTEKAIDYFTSLIPINAAQNDQIDVEAVGTDTDKPWLKDHVVRPQPGSYAPPFVPGWVRNVTDYTQFANTLHEKFQAIFLQIENCATLVSPADLYSTNNVACVTVTID